MNEDYEDVLRKLVEIRNNPEMLEKFSTPEWVWREVVASSLLSGIDANRFKDSVFPLLSPGDKAKPHVVEDDHDRGHKPDDEH